MSQPATSNGTRPRRYRLLAPALLLALTACSSTSADPRPVAVAEITGPLCAALPTGDDPGNPTFLAGQPVDEALRWMPTLTTFEAALRASGVLTELPKDGLTVLAPSDDAFAAKFSEDNWDDLMVRHTDKLRPLLKAHLVAGTHSIDDLLKAGTATTLDGTTITVTGTAPTVRLADRADTVCADYRATNTRIHIINAVLGTLPTTANDSDHKAH